MFPFFPSAPDQQQPPPQPQPQRQQGFSNPSFQQSMFVNQSQLPYPPNNQWNPPPLVNQFAAPQMSIPNLNSSGAALTKFPSFPSVLPQLQDFNLNHQGVSLALALRNIGQFTGQQNLLAMMQNPNFVGPMQPGGPGWIPNFNQMAMGVPKEQFGLPDIIVGTNQFGSMGGVPFQLPDVHMQNFAGQIGWRGLQANHDISTQQPVSHRQMQLHQMHNNMRANRNQFQVHSAEDGGNLVVSVNSTMSKGKSLSGTGHGHVQREASTKRSLNPQSDHQKNSGNFRNLVKGQQKSGERLNQFAKYSKENGTPCKRRLPINYTAKEVEKWIEARRKNFPSRAKLANKLDRSNEEHGDADDARLHREQLKEILAKQAELGVPVAELPPGYLSEGGNQVSERYNKKRNKNRHGRSNNENKWNNQRHERDSSGRYPNDHGKRGRHNQDNWQSKKQKLQGDVENRTMPRREPTLLQKLLSKDIQRDKSKLLQVFRFMVLNAFFKDWPDKPLEYAEISVKDMEGDTRIISKKDSSKEILENAATVNLAEVRVDEAQVPRDSYAEKGPERSKC